MRLNAGGNEKSRESGIELLRIISMVIIVFHHFAIHSDIDFGNSELNEFIMHLFSIGGKLGVNIFVFISGYFLVKSKFNLKKTVMLVLQVFFWSVVCMSVICLFGLADPKPEKIFQSFFPLMYQMYWFASAYFVMYLLSPFLNIFINAATKKQLQTLLVLIFVLWSVLGTIMNSNFSMSDLTWFIFLYILAAYIRIYPNKQTEKVGLNFALFGACIVLDGILLGVFQKFGWQLSFLYMETKQERCLIKANHILIILAAIFIFLAFKNIKIGNIKSINLIASATFGVYLIHDNAFVRPWLWKEFLDTQSYADSRLFIFYAIAVVLAIYISCTVLELLRKFLIEKPISKLYDIIEPKVKNAVTGLKNKKD